MSALKFSNRVASVSALVIGAIATPFASASVITSYTASGNVGAEVAAFATAGGPGSGTLALSAMPAGASVLQAYLYANNYFSSPSASATFAGTPLGSTSAYATDVGFTSYRWDVTSLVTGNGSYSASYSGLDNTYGLALAVVFSHASLPTGAVCINDGAFDMGPGGSATSHVTRCSGLAAGPGTLWIHTAADNALGQSDDQILYNGVPIGGPIDANLGDFASLFRLDVTNVAGANAASLSAPSDQFGWDLAVFVGSEASVVPEPGALAVLGIGLAGLAALRRRSK